MEITKREIIASITILAVLFIIGLVCSDKLSDIQEDKEAKYNKALKIYSEDTFKYSMKTNVGNAFIEGELQAKDPIVYNKIKGEYIVLQRVQEEYTRHTKEVTTTDSKGNKTTSTKVYWTWDTINNEIFKSTEVTFMGETFKLSLLEELNTSYLTTKIDGYNLRSKYYGFPNKSKVTLFSNLKNNSISKGTKVFDTNIKDTLKNLKSNIDTYLVFFWVLWSILAFLIIFLFYYAENDWLNKLK